MLRLLRSNTALTFLLATAVCIVASILGSTYATDRHQLTPIGELVGVLSILSRAMAVALNALLLITIAALANRTATRFDVTTGRSAFVVWIVALLALLISPRPEMITQVMSVVLLVLAFHEMMRFGEAALITMAAFNAGFLIACASLLYQPALLVIVLVPVAFFYGQFQSGRPAMTFIVGLVTPYFLSGTIWYVLDQWPQFVEGQFEYTLYIWRALPSSIDLAMLVLLLALGVVSVGSWAFALGQTPLQSRKYFAMTGWWLLLGVALGAMDAPLFPEAGLMFIAPLSIFAGELFHRNTGKVWAELFHLIIVAGVGLLVYLRF